MIYGKKKKMLPNRLVPVPAKLIQSTEAINYTCSGWIDVKYNDSKYPCGCGDMGGSRSLSLRLLFFSVFGRFQFEEIFLQHLGLGTPRRDKKVLPFISGDARGWSLECRGTAFQWEDRVDFDFSNKFRGIESEGDRGQRSPVTGHKIRVSDTSIEHRLCD